MNIIQKVLLFGLCIALVIPFAHARGPRKRKKRLTFSPAWVKPEPVKQPPFSFLRKAPTPVTPTIQSTVSSAVKQLGSLDKQVAKKSQLLRKKRILIFSSIGGGGHTAVSNGLNSYLFDEYEILVVNLFKEVLGPLDTLGTLSFGKMGGEDLYNFCLRARWTGVAGSIARAGNSYFNWRQDAAESCLLDYFKYAKPDLIISVIPIVNGAVLAVAQKLDIPLLILTNDLDTTNYLNGISKPTYKKFKITLAFEDPTLREKMKPAGIPESQIAVAGFPLRPEFFKPKDVPALKKEFNVPPDKPVVMVFMGGAGSMTSYRYVRVLARMGIPLHMIIVLGRNERLKRNINKIMLPEGVTMTLLGFTNRIADLMAMSDVLITKPGPGSVCEALESNVPMILDATQGSIWWEETNIDFMTKHGFAIRLNDVLHLEKELPRYIKKNSPFVSGVKKKMKEFKREQFCKTVKPLVEEMLAL